MFVAKPQIKTSIPYLQKPINKMTVNDMLDMAEKTSKIFKPKAQIEERCIATNIEFIDNLPNMFTSKDDSNRYMIYDEVLSDMFTRSGKLNRKGKKEIKIAMKDGRLPKKALIKDFYYSILNTIAETNQH